MLSCVLLVLLAQSADDWQKAAGGKMAFEVASIKRVKPDDKFTPPLFPLDSGESFKPTGGRFVAGL
jgi:hypothetical protein